MALTRPKFTQLNTTVTTLTDTLTVLNSNSTTANLDVGFVINRDGGTTANTALFWDESANTFAAAFTTTTGASNSNVSIAGYANVSAGYFIGDGSLLTNVAGSSYGNATVASYLAGNIIVGNVSATTVTTTNLVGNANVTVTGNMLPSANITYDLGSPTQRWREGWFSGSTIHIGDESISVDNNGKWTFTSDGAAVELGKNHDFNPPNANISGNVTATNYLFANGTPVMTLVNTMIGVANTAMKGYTDGELSSTSSSITTANTAMKGYVDGELSSISSSITTANTAMKGYVDGAISTTSSSVTTANTAMKGYVDAVTTAWTANAGAQAGSIATLISNAASQAGSIAGKADLAGATFTGPVSIESNLSVTGNLIISGNITTTGVDNLQLDDALLYVAHGNNTDFLDIGIVGSYTMGSQYQHTGIVRDATDGYWKFFANVESEPTTTIDFGSATYSSVKAGNVIATGNVVVGSNIRLSGALSNSDGSGGTPGQYLSTTGTGVAWTTIELSTNTINDATESSNVTATSNDVDIWANGTNSARFYNDIAYIYTSLTTTGNITAPYFVGNIDATNLNITGNVQYGATNYVSQQYVVWGTTSNAVETEIFVNGISSLRIPVETNTTMMFEVQIVARRTDATNESASWHVKGCADNFSGNVADVGDIYEIIVARDDASWVVDVRADDTTNSLGVYVTGNSGKTIRWTAVVKTIEVSQ